MTPLVALPYRHSERTLHPICHSSAGKSPTITAWQMLHTSLEQAKGSKQRTTLWSASLLSLGKPWSDSSWNTLMSTWK